MKRYLLPETGTFYKANLHSHSTVSDGTLSPAEMKALYKSRGYSVLACTDHELLVPHHDLTDEDFLMLTGFELGFDEGWRSNFLHARVCDLCMIALDPENTTVHTLYLSCRMAGRGSQVVSRGTNRIQRAKATVVVVVVYLI